ncbi:molybdate ABC transporter substrate-binding protein [Knoellia sp. Soil729]|uniref:molybdate ABC transporter substrate-binding protein n=1 Tax=Knoellia sp. Soil729 TaxID=1736394 RepID=UPI0006F76F91|nr:molybdate ABC transporter substrate-binding protein [Knoellia sp. Soil729]KRE43865.1 molybdate-binding protein [Knoellia sp. Soil729]
MSFLRTNHHSYAVRSWSAVAGLLLLAACGIGAGADADTNSTARQQSSASTPDRTLTVFAAASLQKPFTQIGKDFESAHPGVTVRFSFGGSSGLVTQLSDGAPADVLATANEATMDQATAADLVSGQPTPFVSNTLQIVVPQDNPVGISSLTDLTKPAAKVVVCAPAVPCGAATLAVERAAGIDLKPASEEQSVTDVLGKVRSGQADAGLVYLTDVAGAAGDVKGIDFPEAKAAVNTYPIARLRDARDAALATQFMAAVTGPQGQDVLKAAGFAAP